jgi:hypothetical protein
MASVSESENSRWLTFMFSSCETYGMRLTRAESEVSSVCPVFLAYRSSHLCSVHMRLGVYTSCV